jgi:hypothetical protein
MSVIGFGMEFDWVCSVQGVLNTLPFFEGGLEWLVLACWLRSGWVVEEG